MDISSIIMTIDNMLWATPLIALTFGLAVVYCFAIKFGNVTKFKLQWQLLTKGAGSEEGLSPFETFCSVAAYRVAVGNIGGVMVAIMYGGPGSVFWMIITALVTSAIAYAENCLGQLYRVRMDGQYRGGPYFYMEKGIPWKPLGKVMAVCFALFATIGVPFLVTGPSANNIAMAFGNSFGETPPSAAAAETPHPANQGLVNAFSVYINVVVCFCSGIMALVSDCFNVLGPDGVSYMHIGAGSAPMAEQAATNTAGVVWVQEAANSVIPSIGGMIIAIALTCFAYSTCIAYYYEGESGLAYLARNMNEKTHKAIIGGIRIIMPIFFFIWANVTASTAWAISEVMFALMAWFNLISLIFLLPNVKKVYDDYMEQQKAGVEHPFFNPQKVGIKNVDLWMDINKDPIEANAKAKLKK